jgi:hypothetical protein
MRLSISTKPGLIGIRTMPGQLNMKNRAARLEMHQEQAALEIETRRPVLEINQYQVRAQLGYKSTADTTLELSQLGRQKAMEYIASKTEEGNRLKAIEKGGNPIREISIDKAWPQKQKQGGFTPIVGPDFHATPGEVIITPPPVGNPTHIGYEAEYIPGELNIQFNPARVDIYMRQYPEINIDVII